MVRPRNLPPVTVFPLCLVDPQFYLACLCNRGVRFVTLIPSDKNGAVLSHGINAFNALYHRLKVAAGRVAAGNYSLNLLKILLGNGFDESDIFRKGSIE